jgi:hypothetical protein
MATGAVAPSWEGFLLCFMSCLTLAHSVAAMKLVSPLHDRLDPLARQRAFLGAHSVPPLGRRA